MITRQYVHMMASYNQWMNMKLYEVAGKLSPKELAADRNAFFGSILATLNHITVADTIWLKRFAMHPANHAALDPVRQLPLPGSFDTILFRNLGAMDKQRKLLDEVMTEWAAALTEEDLRHVLHYKNSKGVPAQKRLSGLVMHLFNHQTHHRGQVATLLSQVSLDLGVTDLLALIPNEIEE